jgi:hypothetical protein
MLRLIRPLLPLRASASLQSTPYPGALDGADGQAPSPAMKGICFSARLRPLLCGAKAKFKYRRIPCNKPNENRWMEFLSRHVTGDWGEIPEEEKKENQFGLEKGFRLMSSYPNRMMWRSAGSCCRSVRARNW